MQGQRQDFMLHAGRRMMPLTAILLPPSALRRRFLLLVLVVLELAVSDFTIGVLSPESGKWRGKDFRFEGGLQHWVRKINDKGGILRRDGSRARVVLVRADTASSDTVAYNKTIELVRDRGVDILVNTWIKQNEAADRALYENDVKAVYLKCGGGLQYMHARNGNLIEMVPWTRYGFTAFLDGGNYFNAMFTLAMKRHSEGRIPSTTTLFFYDPDDKMASYLCTRAIQEAKGRGIEIGTLQADLVDPLRADAAANRTAKENTEYWVRRMKAASSSRSSGTTDTISSNAVQIVIVCVSNGKEYQAANLIKALQAEHIDLAAIGANLGSAFTNVNYMAQFEHDPLRGNVSAVDYVLSGAMWDPLQSFTDNGRTTMGSSEVFAAEIMATYGRPADVHYAGCPAILTAVEDAMVKILWDPTDREESTERLQASLREVFVDTFWGPIRFDRLNMNVGRDPAMIQAMPRGNDILIPTGGFDVPSVLPESNSAKSIVFPMPTWEAREGCPPGKYLDGFRCAPCPPHHFSVTVGATECSLCPAGHDQPQMGSTRCEPCMVGTSRETAVIGACSPCSPGRHMALPGARACQLCLPGTISRLPGSSLCEHCQQGTFADEVGKTACSDCPKGYFSAGNGSATCKWCEQGKYNDEVGQTSCATCPAGLATITVAADHLVNCTCSTGSYLPRMGGGCQPCGVGLLCEIGSAEVNIPSPPTSFGDVDPRPRYPRVMETFYSEPGAPMSVFKCMQGDVCPGELPGTCAYNRDGLACGTCIEGHYKNLKGHCVSCNTKLSQWMLVLCAMLLIPFTWVMAKMVRTDVQTWGTKKYSAICIASVLWVFTQTLAVLNLIKIDLPVNIRMTSNINFHTLDVLSIFQWECLGLQDFAVSHVIKLLWPLCYALICTMTYLISRVVALLSPSGRVCGHAVISWFGSVFMALFMSAAAQTLSIFMCYQHPNGKLTVRTAGHVLCHSDAWFQMVAASTVVALFFCAGSFSAFAYILVVAPKCFNQQSFRVMTKFIFVRFRPGWGIWSVVMLFKGTWVVLATVLFFDPVGQILWLVFGVLAYSIAVAFWMPWRCMKVSEVDILTHAAAVLIYISSSCFVEADDSTRAQVGTISVVFCCLIYVMCIGVAIHQTYRWRRGMNAEAQQSQIDDDRREASEFCSVSNAVADQKHNVAILLGRLAGRDRNTLRAAKELLLRETGRRGLVMSGTEPMLTCEENLRVFHARQ